MCFCSGPGLPTASGTRGMSRPQGCTRHPTHGGVAPARNAPLIAFPPRCDPSHFAITPNVLADPPSEPYRAIGLKTTIFGLAQFACQQHSGLPMCFALIRRSPHPASSEVPLQTMPAAFRPRSAGLRRRRGHFPKDGQPGGMVDNQSGVQRRSCRHVRIGTPCLLGTCGRRNTPKMH